MRNFKQSLKNLTGVTLVTLSLSGCGGAPQEPKSGGDESAEYSEPVAADPDDEAEPVGDSNTPAASDSGDSAPATQQDLQEALQLVLQDDALQNSMRLTEPGRFPVKISGDNLPAGLNLVAGTEAVQIVPPPSDATKEAVLVFVSIDLNATSGAFKFRYDIEGIRGTAQVKKTDGRWELTSSRVSEYLSKE